MLFMRHQGLGQRSPSLAELSGAPTRKGECPCRSHRTPISLLVDPAVRAVEWSASFSGGPSTGRRHTSYHHPVVAPFNWPSWDGVERYRCGAGLAGAPVAEAARLAAAYIRSERFCDGAIDGGIRDGTFAAILERLSAGMTPSVAPPRNGSWANWPTPQCAGAGLADRKRAVDAGGDKRTSTRKSSAASSAADDHGPERDRDTTSAGSAAIDTRIALSLGDPMTPVAPGGSGQDGE